MISVSISHADSKHGAHTQHKHARYNKKMLLLTLTVTLFTLVPLSLQQTVDVRCTGKFCEDSVALKPCPPLPEACLNASIPFRLFPSPDPCNCCQRCLLYLDEGDECALGDYGQPPPDSICGAGLSCSKDPLTGIAVCGKMNTTCGRAQAAYDELAAMGETGVASWRPSCDDRGLYAPAQCVPNTLCFCVEPYSSVRVFGEAVFESEQAQKQMQCNCARAAWRASLLLGDDSDDVRVARCREDGHYEPLQCVAGKCVCVDKVTGEPDPEGQTVDVNDLVEGSLPCFDSKRHQERRYELPCERERREALTRQREMASLGVTALGLEDPTCAPDGSYHKLQVRGGWRVCVDPLGEPLEEDYRSPLSEEPPALCHCARARWLLRRSGRWDLPRCCPRGDYEAWQCWRGTCFCVDLNGSPTSGDVNQEDLHMLPCYKEQESPPCATNDDYYGDQDPTTTTTTTAAPPQ